MPAPIEHPPNRYDGSLDGHHILRGRDPYQVVVTVRWDDGTVTEEPGDTQQWTRTRVCVRVPSGLLWVPAEDVRRA